MENIKSTGRLLIILVVLVSAGYWAFFTIEPGSLNAEKQKQTELIEKNKELENQVEILQSQLDSLNAEKEIAILDATNAAIGDTSKTDKPTTSTYKNQTLINELQKLILDKVYMKEKSQGTRVGTVQKFLNLYFGTSKKVDNDYGAGTKADVIKFQKDQGITADGETGPGTYQKMIDWLKKQG